MFYDETIQPYSIVNHMIEAQKEIEKLLVHIGLGIHRGIFWEIGGGLYGDEADFVEGLAESHTDGGEIVLSETVRTIIESKVPRDLLTRTDPDLTLPVYSIDYKNLHPSCRKVTDKKYPVPFDQTFFEALQRYHPGNPAEELSVLLRYQSNKIVVLV